MESTNKKFFPVVSYAERVGKKPMLVVRLIAGISLIQVGFAALQIPTYLYLMKMGVTSTIGFGLFIATELLLFFATILLIRKRRGDELFFFAAVFFLANFAFLYGFSSIWIAYSLYGLGFSVSLAGWLATRPQLSRVPKPTDEPADALGFYWDYKSYPELKNLAPDTAKQIHKNASFEASRRIACWKILLFPGIPAAIPSLVFGTYGLPVQVAIMALWITWRQIVVTRRILREMGHLALSN